MRNTERRTRTVEVEDTATTSGCTATIWTNMPVSLFKSIEENANTAESVKWLDSAVESWDGYDMPKDEEHIAKLSLAEMAALTNAALEAIRNP